MNSIILPFYHLHIFGRTDHFIDYSDSKSFEDGASGGSSNSGNTHTVTKRSGGWFMNNWSSTKVSKREFSENSSHSSSTKIDTKTRMITSTMIIERYYSSVKEEISPLSESSKQLLANQDYVGFFLACGPNYVRSIRRSQELLAVFKFKTASTETSKQFASSLREKTYESTRRKSKKISIKFSWRRGIQIKTRRTNTFQEKSYSGGNSKSSSQKFQAINNSLVIKIVGFGLGLNQEGSETLVANTVADHDRVMRFAFNAMTKHEDAFYIGQVYGIEVVPWVHNTAFQVAAKADSEPILKPIPRSMIPRAYKADGSTTWDTNQRSDFVCKKADYEIDKFGYCCEIEQLLDPSTGEYTGVSADLTTHVCRPLRMLDPFVIKDNMSNNGEFVARLDAAVRYRLVSLATLERCISHANGIPESYKYHVLKTQDSVKYEGLIETQISLTHLKMAMDPKGDYALVRHMANELDEWIEMFFSPCYAALYGTHSGSSPGLEINYFMAYPWYDHEECRRLSCLTNNMRWDRHNGGGCVPALAAGTVSGSYETGEDAYCAKSLDKYDEEECKYPQSELKQYREDTVTDCWSGLPTSSVDHLVNYFCMPQLSGEILPVSSDTETDQSDVDTLLSNCGAP